ncbi:hypothetical protein QQ045_002281 [Rhodiola kirilowii]
MNLTAGGAAARKSSRRKQRRRCIRTWSPSPDSLEAAFQSYASVATSIDAKSDVSKTIFTADVAVVAAEKRVRPNSNRHPAIAI